MKKVFILISICSFFLLTFSSCKKKDVVIPDDIFKQNTMVAIMVDVQIAEAAISINLNADSIKKSSSMSFYKYVFEKHKITQKQFIKSMDWYAKHPALLRKVYENVIIELSKKQSEVANKK